MKKRFVFFLFFLSLAFCLPMAYQAQPPVDAQLAGAQAHDQVDSLHDTIHLGELAVPITLKQEATDVPDPGSGSAPGDYTADDFVNKFNGLYAALVFILGLLMKVIKVKNELKVKTALMVISGGLIIGLIFWSVGWVKAIPLVITFLTTTGLYSSILKPIGINVGNSNQTTQ
jgi:hypothetical protein